MAATYTYSGISGDIVFDFTNEEILVGSGYDSLDIQELYDGAREAEESMTGMAFSYLVDGDGKADIDLANSIKTAITVTLLGSWKIVTQKSSGVFTVFGGNLLRYDGTSVFKVSVTVSQILINMVGGMVVATSGDGFGSSDRSTISDIKKIVRGDQRHTSAKVYIKEEGTENVLVEKNVTGSKLEATDDIVFVKAT